MIGRYEAFLNSKALSGISPDILITDISYPDTTLKNETYNIAKRNGSIVHKRYLEKTSVTITFVIRSYDTHKRRAVCSDVVKWAKNGGILETSDRNGQRLRCICDSFPSVNSALNWTDQLKITFSAYSYPYWEEKIPATLSLTGSSNSGTLYVPGNFDGAFIQVSAKANDSVSSLSLTANGKTMSLTGLSISSGSIINVSYDDNAIQSIKVGTTSLLDKRSGVDDLLANCGEYNTLSYSASASMDVTFNVRGLWL